MDLPERLAATKKSAAEMQRLQLDSGLTRPLRRGTSKKRSQTKITIVNLISTQRYAGLTRGVVRKRVAKIQANTLTHYDRKPESCSALYYRMLRACQMYVGKLKQMRGEVSRAQHGSAPRHCIWPESPAATATSASCRYMQRSPLNCTQLRATCKLRAVGHVFSSGQSRERRMSRFSSPKRAGRNSLANLP